MGTIRVDAGFYGQLCATSEDHQDCPKHEQELLNKIIDVLGLRDAYPNEQPVKPGVVYAVPVDHYWPYPDPTQYYDQRLRVVTGASKFKADVFAAADAVKGEDALARLRAAMKENH